MKMKKFWRKEASLAPPRSVNEVREISLLRAMQLFYVSYHVKDVLVTVFTVHIRMVGIEKGDKIIDGTSW